MAHRREEKSERELFDCDTDDLNTQLEFSNNISSKQYKSTMRIISLVMKTYLLVFTYGKQSNGYQSNDDYDTTVKNTLKLSEVKLKSEKSNQSIATYAFKSVILTIAIYISIKYGALGILRFYHDSLVKKLKRKYDKNPYTVTITQSDELDMETVNQFNYWLSHIGDPMLLLYGFAIIQYSFASVCTLVVFLLGHQLLSYKEVRIDSLAFLIDPIGHTLRIRKVLRHISTKLVCSLINENRQYNSIDSYGNKIDGYKYHDVILRPVFLHLQDRLELIQLLVYIDNGNLVKPANLSSFWHRKLIRYAHLGFKMVIITGSVIILTLNLFSLSGELYLRVKMRLNLNEAEKVGRNVTFVRKITHFEELSNPQDRIAYARYDGSISNFISLGLLYELKNILKHFNNCLTYLELNIFTFFATLWMTFPIVVILLGLLDKTHWANQVSSQVHHCLVLLASKKTRLDEHDKGRLLRVSTLAYLNYSLFKMEYRKYLISSSIMQGLLQGSIFVMLIIAYSVIGYAENDFHTFRTMIVVYVIALLDLIMILLIKLMEKMKDVMKNINSMLSYRVDDSRALMYSMELWRRHLIDTPEFNLTFATRVFGVQLTSENIVAVNFYLIILSYLTYNG